MKLAGHYTTYTVFKYSDMLNYIKLVSSTYKL